MVAAQVAAAETSLVDLAEAALPAVTAILGLLVGSWLTGRRERQQWRRQDLREAYARHIASLQGTISKVGFLVELVAKGIEPDEQSEDEAEAAVTATHLVTAEIRLLASTAYARQSLDLMNEIADTWSRTSPDERRHLQRLVAQHWVQAAYGRQQALVELARKDLSL